MTDAYETDIQACWNVDAIKTAVETMSKIVDDFKAQDDWESIMKQNIEDNQHTLEGINTQMLQAYDHELYLQAGMLGGQADQILFKMPDSLTGPDTDDPASTYYAGLMYTWFNMDVSRNLYKCFTPDSALNDSFAKYMEDLRAQDWDAASKEHENMDNMFATDIQACMGDPTVKQAVDTLSKTVDDFKAQPDWETKMQANIDANSYMLQNYTIQQLQAYDLPYYFQTGSFEGYKAKLIFAM